MKTRIKKSLKKNIFKFILRGLLVLIMFVMTIYTNKVGFKNDLRIIAGYWYVASTAVTRYFGSGSCVAGGGYCYKMTGYSSAYFTNGATCDATCPAYGSYSGYSTCTWYPPLYSYTASGSVTSYNFSGSCASGSGNCYKSNGLGTSYTSTGCIPAGTCSSGLYNTGATLCTWYLDQNSYTASNSVTKYTFSGACSGVGTGSCYKNAGTGTAYTSGACGSGGCSSSSYNTGATICSWIGQRYTYTAAGSATSYNLTGACSGTGLNNCYKSSGTATSYTSGVCGSLGCSTSSYNTGVTGCAWNPQLYNYTISGATTTGYNFSGASACNTSGGGSCYAPNVNLSSQYCANGSGCGGTPCVSCSNTYSTATTCTFSTGSDQDVVTLTQGANDLTTTNSISFWVYSTNRTGNYMQFQMGEVNASEQTFSFSVNALNTWEQKMWNISGIAPTARDAITKFAFKNTDGSSGFTFYFDDVQALAVVPTPGIPTACIIRESPKDTFLNPIWIDNATTEDGYQLEKNTNSAGYIFLTNLGVNVTGYQDATTSSGNTYGYRLRSFKIGVGSTYFSDYLNCPTLDLHLGNFRFNGLKMNGVNLN